MFTVFEHTADLGVRVEAASLPEALADAARGLFAVIAGDLGQISPLVEETFTVPDLATL
jgi:SHS2 domain-containing protein